MIDSSFPYNGNGLFANTTRAHKIAAAAAAGAIAVLLATSMFASAFAATTVEIVEESGGLKFIGTPTFTINPDNSVTATGEVSGAGTGGTADLTANAVVTKTCENKGGNFPPGQIEQTVAVSGTSVFDTTKQGRGVFSVTTDPVDTTGLTCPPGMAQTHTTVTFTDAMLKITADNNPDKKFAIATATFS